MGNTSPSPEDYDLVAKFRKQEWLQFATSPSHDLWKHRSNEWTAEVYRLYEIPSIEEMNIYQFRSQHEEIVKVHHLAVEMNDNMCTKYENFQVLVEHIPFRLYNFNFLDTQEAFTILSDALKGFGLIEKHLGAVEPNQELICFNEKGRVKVWLNKKINLNYADTHLQEDNQNTNKKVSQHVRRLYEIIEQRSKRNLLPAGLKQHFLATEHTYQSAIAFIQDFASRNGLTLSHYLRFELIRTEIKHKQLTVLPEISLRGHNRNRSSLNVSVSEYSQPAQRIIECNQAVGETPVVNQMRRILSLGNINIKKSTIISPEQTLPVNTQFLQRARSRFGNTSQIITRPIPKISFIHNNEPVKVFDRSQFARHQSPPPMFATIPSPKAIKPLSSPSYPTNNLNQLARSINEEKHITSEALHQTSKLTSTVVTDYAIKKPEQSLFASQEMSKEVKEPSESSPRLSANKSIIDRVESLASKDSRVLQEEVEESFQKEEVEQAQISPSFAGVSESYHQFVSFAPTQENIQNQKQMQIQGEPSLSFKLVEAKAEVNIQNIEQNLFELKQEDDNISFHEEVILQQPSKSELPHIEQLASKNESVDYQHERSASQGIYSHDYVSVESKLDVAFRKQSFASHAEVVQVEKSERTSIMEHMIGDDIEKYIREKYSSYINNTQKPKHKLRVDRVTSQYEKLEVKQDHNYEINVNPEPRIKMIHQKPKIKIIELQPKRQVDEDFLDVNFLEKSLDLKYKGQSCKSKSKQEPEEDDLLNVAKLQEGLLKFSASQLSQKHMQKHEKQDKHAVSRVSIKQHIVDQDTHREQIQQIDDFSIKYIDNPQQKYHQIDNYSSLYNNKWENSTGFDPYNRQSKFISSYQPYEPIESTYQQYHQPEPYNYQKKKSYEYQWRGNNYIDEGPYEKSYLTKNPREYMEPLEEYSYNSKYRSYEYDKPRLSSKPCKIQAKFDRYVKASDSYKPTSSYQPKRTIKATKPNRYDEADSFAKDKSSIEDSYGNNPLLASKPSSRISYDQLRSLLWN